MPYQTSLRVNWGAIIAGSFITLAFGTVFLALGHAIGVQGFLPGSEGPLLGSWLYTFATLLISFFCGGYCTTRIASFDHRIHGVFHALTGWAVAIISSFAVASFAVPAFLFQFILTTDWLMFLSFGIGAGTAMVGGAVGISVERNLIDAVLEVNEIEDLAA